MPIVIGLMLVCALLYFWLQGHWFARILAAPVMAAAAFAGVFAAMITNFPDRAERPGIVAAALLIAVPAGWLLASVPVWYLRFKADEVELARKAAVDTAMRNMQPNRLIPRA